MVRLEQVVNIVVLLALKLFGGLVLISVGIAHPTLLRYWKIKAKTLNS